MGKAITGSGRAGEIAHYHEEGVMAKIKTVEVEVEKTEENISITKPGEFDLNKFKAKQTATSPTWRRSSHRCRCTTWRPRRISCACIPTSRTIGRMSFVSWTCRSKARNAIPCI